MLSDRVDTAVMATGAHETATAVIRAAQVCAARKRVPSRAFLLCMGAGLRAAAQRQCPPGKAAQAAAMDRAHRFDHCAV